MTNTTHSHPRVRLVAYRRFTAILTATLLLAGVPAPRFAAAQDVVPPPPTRGGQGRLDRPRDGLIAQQLEARINTIIRKRLALTDDQFGKLRAVAGKVEDERRVLRREEMVTRSTLRRELLAGDQANETVVGEMLEQLPKYERRRLDLMEREQRELARFLSPVQRAKYIGLQDELRRSMQDVQHRRMERDSSAGPGDRPAFRRPNRPPL